MILRTRLFWKRFNRSLSNTPIQRGFDFPSWDDLPQQQKIMYDIIWAPRWIQ